MHNFKITIYLGIYIYIYFCIHLLKLNLYLAAINDDKKYMTTVLIFKKIIDIYVQGHMARNAEIL